MVKVENNTESACWQMWKQDILFLGIMTSVGIALMLPFIDFLDGFWSLFWAHSVVIISGVTFSRLYKKIEADDIARAFKLRTLTWYLGFAGVTCLAISMEHGKLALELGWIRALLLFVGMGCIIAALAIVGHISMDDEEDGTPENNPDASLAFIHLILGIGLALAFFMNYGGIG